MDSLELAWITVLLLWTQQSAVEEEEGAVSDSSDAAPTLDRAPSGEMRVLLVGLPFFAVVCRYVAVTVRLCCAMHLAIIISKTNCSSCAATWFLQQKTFTGFAKCLHV